MFLILFEKMHHLNLSMIYYVHPYSLLRPATRKLEPVMVNLLAGEADQPTGEHVGRQDSEEN